MRLLFRHGTPLRFSLQWRAVALVFGTVLLLALGFYRFGLEPMAEHIAESQFATASAQVEASLNAVFQPAITTLRITRGWVASPLPALERPDPFNHVFKPVLDGLPQATSVVAGTSDGEGWMLLSQGEGRWLNRMTDVRHWQKNQLFFEHAADGSDTRYWKSVDYDPRKRAWYAAAVGDKSDVQWTAPYIFFTTGDPGITASTHVPTNDGRDFVIGFDLKLRDLSATTMQARVGRHGMALVMTDDLRVLALPASPPDVERAAWLGKVLQPAAQLGIAPLAGMLEHWRRDAAAWETEFTHQDQAWLARVIPYRLGAQRFWVATLAPKGDFLPDWQTIAKMLAAVLFFLLLSVVLIAHRQALRLARPIEQLATAAERIGRLDFTPMPLADSRIAELGQLATEHENMRSLLRQNQQQLAAQKAELEQRIEAQRAAEAKIRDSEAYNKVLFTDSAIPIGVLDPDTMRFIDCNRALLEIYRIPDRETLLGMSPADVSAPFQYDGAATAEAARLAAQQALARGVHTFEWRHRHRDGREWDGLVQLMKFRHGGRDLLQFTLQDITERKRAASALENLALYDALTDLPNRTLLLDRLQTMIATARRRGRVVAVLYLDLDRFKEVNDTLGHQVGDSVLKVVGQRFAHALRHDETLARVAGDEFAVAVEAEERVAVTYVAERLIGCLRANIEACGHVFALDASVGIALYPDDGDTPDLLLRKADIAMNRAKRSGRGFEIYNPDMGRGLAERMTLAHELKEALARSDGALALHYQPQFDLSTEQLIGAEALLRWHHPALGMVNPSVFIPLAEERGMMTMIGNWVLREACRQLAAWRAEGKRFPGRLAINIAAQEIGDAGFPERAAAAVQAAGLEPAQFELELTESGMMDNVELAIDLFDQLKQKGFALAIDDFGTGYSSLAYLKRLPADRLKIDMSFIRDMIDDANDHAIVATIVGMGKTLGLRTIAEGVETRAQADALKRLGCDEAQGYLLGRPEPAERFALNWLQDEVRRDLRR